MTNNWRQVKLGDCLDRIVGGGTPSKSQSEYWNGKIPWASVKDIVTFNPKQTQDYISEIGLKNSSSNLIPAGTLITPTRMALGHAVTFEVDVAINQDLKALYPDFRLIIVPFLEFWFEYRKKYIEQLGAGSTVSGISLPTLKSLKLLLPPLAEQEKIVEVLEKWDAMLEKLDALIAAKRELKKGLMQELLTGKRRLPGFNGEWREVKLGKLVSISTGKKDVNEGNPEGIYPFFTCAKRYTFSDSYSYDKEAILIAGNGEVGNCKYYKGKFEAYQRTYILSEFNLPVMYLFFYLSHFFQNYVSNQKQMGAMPYIKLGMLQNFKIHTPSTEKEQQAIAEILSTADAAIDALVAKREAIALERKYLLENLVTGKIRVV